MVFSFHALNDLRRTAPHAARVGLLCFLAPVLALACDSPPIPVPTATPIPATAITPTPTPTATPTPAAAPTPTQTPALAPAVTPEEPSVTPLSIVVAPVPDAIPEYDRGEWRHWTDEDGDCQDARQEALVGESVSPVVYTSSDQCRVESGVWVGSYGRTVHGAREVGHRPHGAPRQRPSVRRLGLEPGTEAPVRQ